jgi:hypothetical protein
VAQYRYHSDTVEWDFQTDVPLRAILALPKVPSVLLEENGCASEKKNERIDKMLQEK